MHPEIMPNATEMAPKSIQNIIKITLGVPLVHVPSTWSQKKTPPGRKKPQVRKNSFRDGFTSEQSIAFVDRVHVRGVVLPYSIGGYIFCNTAAFNVDAHAIRIK